MPLEPCVPSPVWACPELSTAYAELWIKNDGSLHPLYGGNKVRKLQRILERARAAGARRILTFGPAGSHHVLSTALFAPLYGLRSGAVLFPQLRTEHAEQMLRVTAAQDIELYPAAMGVAGLGVAASLARAFRPGDVVVPPGGSNACGAAAYADAVGELCDQVARGELPAPDSLIVALGSGGTAAGLAAGFAERRLATQVVAVDVVGSHFGGAYARALAGQVLFRRTRRLGLPFAALRVEQAEPGVRYGEPSARGESATQLAAEVGLVLDPSYTAKAFAKALELTERRASVRRCVLYWHTLSSVPFAPLLARAPPLASLPPSLRGLLLPPRAPEVHALGNERRTRVP